MKRAILKVIHQLLLSSERKHIQLIIITAFAGILIRLLFINFWHMNTTTDSFAYIYQAKCILSGHPVSSFPNGYPLIIALLLLFIPQIYLLASLIIVNLAAQIVTGVLLYKTSILLKFSNNKKLAALFLFALYPAQIFFTNMVLTESISTLLVTASVYFLLKRNFISCGVTGFLLSAFRMSLLLWIPITVIILFFPFKDKKYYKLAAAFILTGLLFHSTDFTGLTKFPSNHKDNLIIAINSYSSSLFPSGAKFNFEDPHPLKAYIHFAVNNPVKFTVQRLDALYQLWGPYPSGFNSKIMKIVFGFRFMLFAGFCFLFYNVLIRKKGLVSPIEKKFIIAAGVSVAMITIIHTIYFSNFRFIVPIEPLLIISFVMCFSLKGKH
jgi:hypothetical protein